MQKQASELWVRKLVIDRKIESKGTVVPLYTSEKTTRLTAVEKAAVEAACALQWDDCVKACSQLVNPLSRPLFIELCAVYKTKRSTAMYRIEGATHGSLEDRLAEELTTCAQRLFNGTSKNPEFGIGRVCDRVKGVNSYVLIPFQRVKTTH